MKLVIHKSRQWRDSPLLWTILLLPHLKTDYMNETVYLDLLFNIGRVISGLLIICMLFFTEKIILNSQILLLIALQGVPFLATVLNHLPIRDACLRFISTICVALLLNYTFRRNAGKAIRVLFFVLSVYALINLTTIILYPDGLYNLGGERRSYFLGHVNSALIYFVPLLLCAFLIINNICLRVSRFFAYVMIGVAMLTVLITWSATSLVVIAVMLILCMTHTVWSEIKIINGFTSYVVCGLATIGILFFQIQNTFAFLIENILHRSLDFTRRIKMWENAIVYIRNKPFVGYGIESIPIRRLILGGPSYHDLFLEMLYQGGVLELALWFLFVYSVVWQLKKYRAYVSSAIVNASIIGLSLASITETLYGNAMFYIVFMIAMNVQHIISMKSEVL